MGVMEFVRHEKNSAAGTEREKATTSPSFTCAIIGDFCNNALVHCLAKQVQYTSAQLAGSHWIGCQLPASTFASGQLQGAVFEDCRFLDSETSDGSNFRFCNMVDACFRTAIYHWLHSIAVISTT